MSINMKNFSFAEFNIPCCNNFVCQSVATLIIYWMLGIAKKILILLNMSIRNDHVETSLILSLPNMLIYFIIILFHNNISWLGGKAARCELITFLLNWIGTTWSYMSSRAGRNRNSKLNWGRQLSFSFWFFSLSECLSISELFRCLNKRYCRIIHQLLVRKELHCSV